MKGVQQGKQRSRLITPLLDELPVVGVDHRQNVNTESGPRINRPRTTGARRESDVVGEDQRTSEIGYGQKGDPGVRMFGVLWFVI